DRVAPFIPPARTNAVLDLRGMGNIVAVTPETAHAGLSVAEEHAAANKPYLYPLFFGAGWKTLDLLIERVTGEKQIKDKATKAAGNTVGAVQPFDNAPDQWTRLMLLYATTTT
ncbi:MAG TPA: hypothetical protein VJW55_08495, partial [Candidatus Angelobacter sp.]|nr:hypothetical protein [Candidatus Angelobacter sp.]